MVHKPLVGVLYNPVVPFIIDHSPALVEYVEVIPDRFWYDFGANKRGRFHRVHGAIETLKHCITGRVVGGHGIGLSLPSAMPLDEAQVEAIAALAADLGFQWYSEHLSMFLVPHGSVPNAQAGLGLPVVYTQETFNLLAPKLDALRRVLGCNLLMENGAIFTPIPDMEMTEPEFLNRLFAELGCGTLLDLHNLYVSWRNGGQHPREYLQEIDPNCVQEIHMAGGDEMAGFYTDSHSQLTPADVWSWAYEFAPRFKRLQAIVFEFHESYFETLGMDNIVEELERIRALCDALATSEDDVYAS